MSCEDEKQKPSRICLACSWRREPPEFMAFQHGLHVLLVILFWASKVDEESMGKFKLGGGVQLSWTSPTFRPIRPENRKI